MAHVTARSLTLEGDGVAALAGRDVTVPGLFPGESGRVHIDAVSKQHPRAHGSLRELLTPHAGRRSAPCPNHVGRGGGCTGCALMELEEGTQRDAKRGMLRERFGLDVSEVVSGTAALGYRWSSKRIVFAGPDGLCLGSFARGSHRPAAMPACLVDHPRLSAAFDRVAEAARELGIEAYDEGARHGDLRYVWGKTNGAQVIVTLVTAGAESRARTLLPERLAAIDGVLWSVQGADSNVLRGSDAVLLRGCGELATRLLDQPVEVGALGFLQPNPQVAELAYRRLTELAHFMGPRALAFDLYAGAGVTTRALRAQFRDVVPCEVYPESARALGVVPQSVESFLGTEQANPHGRKPDLVVANPPRKGMGQAVCGALRALSAAELRIMSCGPEGLARDLEALRPVYELVDLCAFDTLPQTPHVELVARLRRRGAPA